MDWPIKSLAFLSFTGKIDSMMSQQKSLNSGLILGILGSGQLARMSALAASDFGIETHIYCTEKGLSPAEQVAAKTIKGSFTDKSALLQFCKECDIVTLENEFIDQEILNLIDEVHPGKLFPSSKTFQLIGDKISEKKNISTSGIKSCSF